MRSIPLSFVATLTSGQRPAPDELDVREERNMPVVQHGRVFTRGPAPLNTRTRFSWQGTTSLFFL